MDVVSVLAGLDPQPPDGFVARLQGPLDLATQPELSAALEEAVATAAPRVVIDFSAVTRLSGAVLLPLSVAQARARARGVRLLAVAVPATAQPMFRQLWPGAEMPLYRTAAEALADDDLFRGALAVTSPAIATDGWAPALGPVRLLGFPEAVPRINVQGQTACGPTRGFGRLWHKVYRVPLSGTGLSPAEVVGDWRAHFGAFWPAGNQIHLGPAGIAPGAAGVITLAVPPGLQLITGVQVAYSGEDCFVFLPLSGHMFCGLIVFGALEVAGALEAQVQVLVRASDPLWETAMTLGGYAQEDQSWFHTLTQLARHLGSAAPPEMIATVVDGQWRWSEVGEFVSNSALWSGVYQALQLAGRLGGVR